MVKKIYSSVEWFIHLDPSSLAKTTPSKSYTVKKARLRIIRIDKVSKCCINRREKSSILCLMISKNQLIVKKQKLFPYKQR